MPLTRTQQRSRSQELEGRKLRFDLFMERGTYVAAFVVAVMYDMPRRLIERAATFAYSKAGSETNEKTLLKAILGEEVDLSDPLARYDAAMGQENYFLAALVLREDIIGLDEEDRDRRIVNAVQVAFTKAALERDSALLERLKESFPEYRISQGEEVSGGPAEAGGYIDLVL